MRPWLVALLGMLVMWGMAGCSELSTYAKQNCLLSVEYGDFNCDITSNPLLFKQSTLPGLNDVVYISGVALNLTIGKSVTYLGLIIQATDSYVLLPPGTNLIVGNVTVGENSTLEIGGNLVVQGVCEILQYSQLRVWDQSLASFISLNSGQLSQVVVFAGGEIQVNASSNFTGILQLSSTSLFMVNGTANFSSPLVGSGNVFIAGTIITDSYTQANGKLQLNGTIMSPTTSISETSTLSGGGSVHGDLVLNGTLDVNVVSEAVFDTLTVHNTAYIYGNLVANINGSPVKKHPRTYTVLSAGERIGRFVLANGSWFTNASATLTYERADNKDLVQLVVPASSFTPSVFTPKLSIVILVALYLCI